MPRVVNPGGAGGVTSVTGTPPVTSSGGVTPAIGLTPLGYWQPATQAAGFTTIGFVANQTPCVGVIISWPLSVSHLTFNVTTLDNSTNKYDFGLYNAAGTLVANIGAASYTTSGAKTGALAQGTVTLNPGLYFLAFTGNSTVMQFSGLNAGASNWQYGASANAGAS